MTNTNNNLNFESPVIALDKDIHVADIIQINNTTESVAKQVIRKNSMTNAKMVTELKDNIDNVDYLTSLFNQHELLFIKMVQCIRDKFKLKVLPIIQTKYPNAEINRKNAKVKQIILN